MHCIEFAKLVNLAISCLRRLILAQRNCVFAKSILRQVGFDVLTAAACTASTAKVV
jgi:hypothetical protein